MKKKEKAILQQCRPFLIRSMDMENMMPDLAKERVLSPSEQQDIMKDPRRRHRVMTTLDLLEKKRTEAYGVFCDVLSAQYPHLFLIIAEAEQGAPREPDFDEEWAALQRIRRYLIKEIEVTPMLDAIVKKGIIDEEEKAFLYTIHSKEIRTEAYLDILEMKNADVYDEFLEIIADFYPHVYLAVTGQIGEEEDDDDF